MIKKFKGHPRFLQLLDEMKTTHHRKTNDYSGDVPLQDLREVEQIGIPAWKGSVARLLQKVGRLKQLSSGRRRLVKDESLRDTLMDIASGALISVILKEEDEAKKKKLQYQKDYSQKNVK